MSLETLVVEASEVSSQRGSRDALCSGKMRKCFGEILGYFLTSIRCYFSLRPKS